MAVAVDATASGTSTGDATLTFAITIGGSATGLLVLIAAQTADYSGNPDPTVTVNGTSMTSAGADNTGTFYDSYIFKLENPPTGTVNVVITCAETCFISAGAISVTGSDTASMIAATNTASVAATGNAGASVTCVADELAVAVFSNGSAGTHTLDGSATAIYSNLQAGDIRSGAAYIAQASDPQSITWTRSGDFSNKNTSIVSIKAAATGNVVQSAGAATVTAASAKLDAQPVSAAGISTVVARGQANSEARVAAAGQAAANILGAAQSAAPVTAAGTATVNIEGNASAAGQTAAQAAGVATVNITGSALAAAEIQAAGEADVRVVGVPTGTGQDYLLWGSRVREDARRRRQIEAEDAELIRIVRVELGPKLLARARRRTVN